MRKAFVFCTVLAGAALAAGAAWGGTLHVVTATLDLKSIAESVGGDKVQTTSIAGGGTDPHQLQAKPTYMVVAHKADLFVVVGLDLEIGWQPLVLAGARNPKIQVGEPGFLDASEGIKALDPVKGFISPFAGDIHPKGNPHYWTDPYNGRVVALEIAQRLAQLDPADKDYFGQRLGPFLKAIDVHSFGEDAVRACGGKALWEAQHNGKLDDLLKEKGVTLGGWFATMKPFRGAKILTYHRSWTYFANAFGLVVADELEPRPGVPPSPAHLRKVIQEVPAEKIRAILVEPFYERRSASLVSERTGIPVVILAISVGDGPGVDDYISLIENMVTQVSQALGKQ